MSRLLCIVVLTVLLAPAVVRAQARILDLVEIEGVQENKVRGLGLVIGLAGTGDKSIGARRLAANFLRRLGVNLTAEEATPDNIAVVIVTATIPPFAHRGEKIDVTVSSYGDAKSLHGGTLLSSNLMDYENKTVYVIAEGGLIVGGVSASGNSGSKESINHPTVGRVPSGGEIASVEKLLSDVLSPEGNIRMRLRDASYITVRALADAINGKFPGSTKVVDGRTVSIVPPAAFKSDGVSLLAALKEVRVAVDNNARVTISERTGTIIAGDNVVLLPVAISSGSLSISVSETTNTSQPLPLSNGTTVTTPSSDVKLNERAGTGGLKVLPGAASAGELARALNTLGVSPRELINIFQMLKSQGSLQAELVVQ